MVFLRLRTISTESSFLSSFLHRRALVSFIATSRLWRTSLSSRASLTLPLSYSSPTCQAVSIPLDSHYSGHCTTGHHPSIYACICMAPLFIAPLYQPLTQQSAPICGLLFRAREYTLLLTNWLLPVFNWSTFQLISI